MTINGRDSREQFAPVPNFQTKRLPCPDRCQPRAADAGVVGCERLDAARLSQAEVEADASREPVLDWRFDDPAAIGRDCSGRNHHAHVSVGDVDRLSPRDEARAALVHALLNSNELIYLD